MNKLLLFPFLPFLSFREKTISHSLLSSDTIIGKWSLDYFRSIRNSSKQFSKFEIANSLVDLPETEFKTFGNFYSADKPGADCSYAPIKYTIRNNKRIKFSEIASCKSDATCQECPSRVLEFISTDNLII